MSNEPAELHDATYMSGGDDPAAFENSFNNLRVSDDPSGAPADDDHEKTDEEYAVSVLTLRAIVSSKEAGVIIGKAGKNVADLREETGVKAGVSKVVPGVHDRVLTVTGALEGIARAYGMVTQTLLENPPSTITAIPPGQHREFSLASLEVFLLTDPISAVRLLISHNQMGTIIGRQGLKIKHIQDVSGARMVAQKEMLPQSTERIVEVQGDSKAIQLAIWEIGKCLVDDWQRGTGTVLYNPAVRAAGGVVGGPPLGGSGMTNGGGYGERGSSRGFARTGNGADFSDPSPNSYRRRSPPADNPLEEEEGEGHTQNISIPADMVGCIIGRGGAKIQEIRRTSGAKISIAKTSHDETGERMFTISGSNIANEKALYLLYENLEAEKLRRNNSQPLSPE